MPSLQLQPAVLAAFEPFPLLPSFPSPPASDESEQARHVVPESGRQLQVPQVQEASWKRHWHPLRHQGRVLVGAEGPLKTRLETSVVQAGLAQKFGQVHPALLVSFSTQLGELEEVLQFVLLLVEHPRHLQPYLAHQVFPVEHCTHSQAQSRASSAVGQFLDALQYQLWQG